MKGKEYCLPREWEYHVENLYHLFQPVVDVHTGNLYGVEALLRGCGKAGFDGIADVFESAFREDVLFCLDMELRKKAIDEFRKLYGSYEVRLFYNLDNRILENPDYQKGLTRAYLDQLEIPLESIFFEISEQHEFSCYPSAQRTVSEYKNQNYRIAIDDFGSGYSGFQLLYYTEPEIIKIDRFLITGIEADLKKRILVDNIVRTVHLMGVKVLAEGVETPKEFYTCRELGCDLIQGFLVKKPVLIEEVETCSAVICSLIAEDRRKISPPSQQIRERIRYVKPFSTRSDLQELLATFRSNTGESFLPCVNDLDEPMGILSEEILKSFVYSPFGISLLENELLSRNIRSYMTSAPTVDINTPLGVIIEVFSHYPDASALIITRNGKYCGVLSSAALIQIINL